MSQARLLLTRPEAQARAFAEAVRVRFGSDFDPVFAPVLRIVHLPLGLDPYGFDGLIFTSRNAVAAFVASSDLREPTAWCVGSATAAAAAEAGFEARSSAGALPALAAQLRSMPRSDRLLHVHGVHTAGDLETLVGADGPQITSTVIYDQLPQPLTTEARVLLAGVTPILLPLFSPRSAALMGEAILTARAPLHIAAMSPAVAAALPVQAQAGVAMAPHPDARGMLQALADLT